MNGPALLTVFLQQDKPKAMQSADAKCKIALQLSSKIKILPARCGTANKENGCYGVKTVTAFLVIWIVFAQPKNIKNVEKA